MRGQAGGKGFEKLTRKGSLGFENRQLSNGVQLADLLAYNVFRAFRSEDLNYPYFEMLLPAFYKREAGPALDGLKVWPEGSPLIEKAKQAWKAFRAKSLAEGERPS